jgi:hypothetical protein
LAPKILQYLDQTTNIGLRLLLLTAQHLLFLPELVRFRTEARQRPLDNAFAGFHAPADLADATDDRFFNCLGRNAG